MTANNKMPQNDDTNDNTLATRTGKSIGIPVIIGIAAVALIVGAAIGLLIGRDTNQTSEGPDSGAQSMRNGSSNRMNPDGMPSGLRGGMGGGSTGEVTAVSATGITLTDARSGGSTTFQIVSDTKVTDGSDEATISDVKVGDTVMVVGTTDDDDAAAATITLNPDTSFGFSS